MKINIRKLIYLPTQEQISIITSDVDTIMSRCKTIANAEWKEQLENQLSHDALCPKCRSRKEHIVNKICLVEGTYNINTELKFGFGKLKGAMNVSTHEVNHCNKCGNEWKKFKTTYVSDLQVLKVTLLYLFQSYDNPSILEKHDWKAEAIKIFDNCCAEAVWLLANKHLRKEKLHLKDIRSKYKSVFDNA